MTPASLNRIISMYTL